MGDNRHLQEADDSLREATRHLQQMNDYMKWSMLATLRASFYVAQAMSEEAKGNGKGEEPKGKGKGKDKGYGKANDDNASGNLSFHLLSNLSRLIS